MTRILHVLQGMNRGGVETWLMHVLRHIDRARFQSDFLVHTTAACAFDDEVRALGGRIHPCVWPARPWEYASCLARTLRRRGPYDVVHSHVHHFSAVPLLVARCLGVPIRIAHSHSDPRSADQLATLRRKIYLAATEAGIRGFATLGLASSEQAAAALFGSSWKLDPRFRVLHCGIDLEPFRPDDGQDLAALRRHFGFPEGALVVGHVGRFTRPKNHAFLIELFAELARQSRDAYLLLVGEGPLQADAEAQVARLGLDERVRFAGLRDDVPRLMRHAMDVVVFPSLYEGLGLVVVEAQAAGVPVVVSDAIPPEATVADSLVTRLTLSDQRAHWVDAIRRAAARSVARGDAFAAVERSTFNIQASVAALEACYSITARSGRATATEDAP